MISGSSVVRRPGDQDLRLGQQQRIDAVDRRARPDLVVAGGKLDLGEAPARAHQQDRGHHREAQDAERERERGDLVPVEREQCREIGVEGRERGRGTRRFRGAGRRERERGAGSGRDSGNDGAESAALRMSPKALHGPDRVRHARLPLSPHSAGAMRPPADPGPRGGVPLPPSARESSHFTPNRNPAVRVQIVNAARARYCATLMLFWAITSAHLRVSARM